MIRRGAIVALGVAALTACGVGETEEPELHRAATSRQVSETKIGSEGLKPGIDLVPLNTRIDDRSHKHVRMTQVFRGVPVVDGESIAHYDATGKLLSSRTRVVDGLDALDMSPSVTKDAAIGTALHAEDGRLYEARLVVTRPRRAKDAILAWEVTLRGDNDDYRLVIDAHSGAIVKRSGLRMQERGTGKGVFGETRTIEYSRKAGTNLMIDDSRANRIVTLDAHGRTRLDDAFVFTSPDGQSWDTQSDAAGAGVDAAFHVGIAMDFFEQNFKRKGWNDDTKTEIPLLVHYGKGFENAQYAPFDGTINFGDAGNKQHPLAAFLDIVAHEYTHGVTDQTSNLAYDGESGALNEAMSDIFGAIIEHSVRPNDETNWLHGEGSLKNVTKIQGADRDFSNPQNSNPPQPAHLKDLEDPESTNDNGNVHANSGIINHAAFLMTMGGENPVSGVKVKSGIGWDKLAKLFYKTNTDYLNRHSDFKDAAGATLDAARDLEFSDADIQTISCAWMAVGLLEGDCEEGTFNSLADGDSVGDDDDSAGSKSTSSSAKKKAAAPDSAAGCAVQPGGNSSPAFYILLALAIIRSRAARGRAGTRRDRASRLR